MRIILLSLVSVLIAGVALAVNWPIPPVTVSHPLGNNWGNYQNYGGSGYFHNGIDVITPDTSGAEVRAVRHGWVKGWGTIQAELHYRVAVCDTNSSFTGRAEGWLYAHVDATRPHKNVGDEVQEGELIGYLVAWPLDATFDHCHFARISDTGATWMRFPNVTWWFTQNPLTIIRPNDDLLVPVFEDARTGARFAFTNNNSSTYQQPTGLVGDVDIIARIHDKTGYTTGNAIWDKLAPYQIDYCIKSQGGTIVVPWTVSLQFSNILDATNTGVVYKTDNTCRSRGDYDRREYFFIVTNTDGDSIIESTDNQGKWATATVGDGNYWVMVRAADVFGNTTVDSMLVTTANGTSVAEQPVAMLTRPLVATPNPARGPVTVRFALGKEARGRARIIDQAGRIVATLADGILPAGEQAYRLGRLAAGIYTVELTIDGADRYSRQLVVAN